MNVKTPNAIDSYVGARIRTRRQLLGMSQERLAEQIGVTFQQVQKYEKGINRIGASRLQCIAEVLHTSPSFFFEQNESQPLSLQGLALPDNADPVAEFLRTKEGLVLNRAFLKIADPDIRETIIALVKAMAQAESAPDLPSIANITRPPLE
ncbi:MULTISPECIES: helix-turn-helix domain-containing protein [unclassified Rhizobium]|uniref:helix-turn-helix domain-containing protein n=1 Tax=unclassified Rhizobium TaxID=2613769 RepID=UPI0007EA64D3|nr:MULTISPECIES: helix-turn-helix domain-containing protein [unclassified Rhizobium]ANK87925.1 XRE family transcriptional regulator protein [Rhizobium sp. N731]ANL18171.1 XRE family transcriptional regulator protein [Rhizobium sp. N1314]